MKIMKAPFYRKVILGALVFGGLVHLPVQAGEREIGVWGAPVPRDWALRLGTMGFSLPAYEGAKNYVFFPLPSFEVDYDDRFTFNINGGMLSVFQNKWISIGPEITPFLGRYENYSDALRGMGNLPFDLKGGAFVGFHSPIGSLVVEGARTMTSSVGATGSISFQSGYIFDPDRFILTVVPGVTWADRSYMENNFGVKPDQSGRTGYPVYLPSAGFYNYWINVAPTFIIGFRHYLIPSVTYIKLIDQARGSPLVLGPGSQHQFVGQISYQYLF